MKSHRKKIFYLLFLSLILIHAGCIPPPERVETPAPPSVIKLSPLPPLTEISHAGKPELLAMFLVRKDGSVDDVVLLSKSGNPEWDRAATESMRNWQFAALPDDIDENRLWIRCRIHIEIEEPVFLNLGEIIASSKEEADSIYALLRGSTDFLTIARQSREGTTTEFGRYLGTVDISQFPQHIRTKLRKLRENRYTRPIKLGDTYVIYKRFGVAELGAVE